MTKYITQERTKYWPITPELIAQYKDGTHTAKTSFGTLYWKNKNGLLHRDGDKPALIYADGRLEWWQNSKVHRDGDLPAWIGRNGSVAWHQNGQRHRSHGPARIHPDGRHEWWINGEEITQEVKKWLNRKRWQGTPEQIFEFQLRFL